MRSNVLYALYVRKYIVDAIKRSLFLMTTEQQ